MLAAYCNREWLLETRDEASGKRATPVFARVPLKYKVMQQYFHV